MDGMEIFGLKLVAIALDKLVKLDNQFLHAFKDVNLQQEH